MDLLLKEQSRDYELMLQDKVVIIRELEKERLNLMNDVKRFEDIIHIKNQEIIRREDEINNLNKHFYDSKALAAKMEEEYRKKL